MQNHAQRPPEDVGAAVRRTTRMWKYNLLLTVALLIGIFAFTGLRGEAMRVDFTRDALSVSGPDGASAEIPYRDMLRVELVDAPDYGACVDGGQNPDCWYGTWRNDLWDAYWLCVRPNVGCCVAIDTPDGVYAVNGASARATEALRDSLTAVMPRWDS